MTGRQILLDLAARQAMGRADFLPSPANQAALTALDGWQDWPGGRMLLVGPPGSGRTHLLRIWAGESDACLLNGDSLTPDALPLARAAPALAVDDAEGVAGDAVREETLFHLFNHAQAAGQPLLLSARDTAGTWGMGLADLESRIQTCPVTRVQRPDDDLLRMVLVKLFHDHQLAVEDPTINFLAARIDRSLDFARRVVEALDQEALSRQKRVSRVMAADVLARLSPPPS